VSIINAKLCQGFDCLDAEKLTIKKREEQITPLWTAL